HTAGMFDSVMLESPPWEDLERIAVKQRSARIFSLFVEIVAQFLQAADQVLLGKRRLNLQAQADARPTRRQRKTLHDRLCRREEKNGFLRPSETPQHRAASAGDFARRFQPIERQIIQSGKYQNI